jgi:AMMECR1 domain-containing protein
MIQSKLKKCAGCEQPKHIWKSSGKEKYCKECWYSIEKPKSISPVSTKRREILDEYSKKRVAYLTLHTLCEAKLPGCTGNSTEIHHKAGKIGENHNKISNFLAVCRSCHSIIELEPEMAKELGFSESRLKN